MSDELGWFEQSTVNAKVAGSNPASDDVRKRYQILIHYASKRHIFAEKLH